jgi:hypothetical protein
MIIRKLDLELVQKFLIFSGFEKRKSSFDHTDIWRHRQNKDELVLPNSRAPDDWRQATSDAINKLIERGYMGKNFEYLLQVSRMGQIERAMLEMVRSKPPVFYRTLK